MLAARGSAASFSATALGSQLQPDLAAAGAWGFLGNALLGPFPCNDFSEAADSNILTVVCREFAEPLSIRDAVSGSVANPGVR